MTNEANTPVEQVSGVGNPQQQAPAENWKPRYDGAVRKIEELTGTVRDLQGQLAAKSSELEQLRSQLSVKDAERDAAVSERDKRIQETIQSKTTAEQELAALRAYKMKVDAVKKLGDTKLVKIIDNIPNMTDPEALDTVLKQFSEFAIDAVREREQQLLSGVTPGVTSGAQVSTPASEKAWDDHINSLPLGSKERQKALDSKWDWLVQSNK